MQKANTHIILCPYFTGLPANSVAHSNSIHVIGFHNSNSSSNTNGKVTEYKVTPYDLFWFQIVEVFLIVSNTKLK